LIVEYRRSIGALCARDCKGVSSQYVDEGKIVIDIMDKTEENATQQAIAFHGQASSTAGVSASEEIAPTLMSAKQIDVAQNYIVRRLTPLECERLQGFPDNWTNIGSYIDGKAKVKQSTDSNRYKALGNSIAIPPWYYVLSKLALCCGANCSMASLFDGIGGFPLIWEQLNGKGTAIWASEIEEFPIAVTKFHFPEQEETK